MSKTTTTEEEVEETTTTTEEPMTEQPRFDMSERDDELEMRLSEAQERIRDLERKAHERSIDDKIAEYSKTWSDHPALLTTVRDLMMADDGGPVLMLSEEGGDTVLSATDMIDRIMAVLPQPAVKLSDQARDVPGKFGSPPENEEEASVEDRAQAAAEWLGDKTYIKSRQ